MKFVSTNDDTQAQRNPGLGVVLPFYRRKTELTMARLNLEDEWFVDATGRRASLIAALQNQPVRFDDAADGMAVRAWRLAQRYWKDGCKLIPEQDWARSGLEPLVIADLAERRPDGIYVRGTEKHADWLLQRVNAGKGRAKQACRDAGKYTSGTPASDQRNTSERPAEHQRATSGTPASDQPLTLALTLPPSLALTPTRRRKEKTMHTLFAQGSPPETPVRDKSQGSQVWEAYRRAYIARYGHEPVRNAKTNGQCSQLVARLGAEAAQKVVQFYLSHGGRWYVQQCHGLGWCLRDCEGLHTQMLANYRVTSSDADSIDRNQSNQQAFEEVAKRLEAEGRL